MTLAARDEAQQQGILDSHGKGYAVVTVTMLGKATPMEIDAALLEPI